jgi:FixJ family two-component response regulator
LRKRAGNALLEDQLSRREREIFRQAATGLANKELAARFRDRRSDREGAPHSYLPEAGCARTR